MITPQKAKEIMSVRGYSETMRGMKGDEVISITFMSEEQQNGSNRTHVPAYSCTVYLETEEFRMQYCIPFSINILQTPMCGSVCMNNHFDKIREKFEDHAHILYRYFGRS